MLDGVVPPLIVVLFAGALTAARRRYMARHPENGTRLDLLIVVLIVGLSAILELAMGRTPTYKYGSVRLWSGDIYSNQNSQQIADPYSFTHLVHGALFYGFYRVALPASPATLRLVAAVTTESAWEVLENTDMVINRYRAATISLDYYGDSVVNSVADIAFCAAGVWLAARLPKWATVCGIVGLELFLGLWIRDNLTLNVLMLVHPMESVRRWQSGLR